MCGCERQDVVVRSQPAPVVAPQPLQEILVFPDSLRVADEAVNEFVGFAMNECAGGDYERFRLLWRATDDPLPRDEYEQGWQAVERIELRALEEVVLAGQHQEDSYAGETAYVVLAGVSLDPNHRAGKREPFREVILLIVNEQSKWRLAKAPNALKTWVREHVASRLERSADGPPDAP